MSEKAHSTGMTADDNGVVGSQIVKQPQNSRETVNENARKVTQRMP